MQVCLWPIAMHAVWPVRLVTNYMEPFCETVLGKGWHAVKAGPDKYHTWCEMDKP